MAGVPSTIKEIAFQECNDYDPKIQEKTCLKDVLYIWYQSPNRPSIAPQGLGNLAAPPLDPGSVLWKTPPFGELSLKLLSPPPMVAGMARAGSAS